MTDHPAEPTATGDPDPTERGDDVNNGTVQQDMATGQSLAVRNPYDADVPATLRERIAYARAMAQAGILPRDYAGKPANVLVAGEMGRELGLSAVQSVLMLNVVEGRPSLGANGVRAVILGAGKGHTIDTGDVQYNEHGVPLSITVSGRRGDTGAEASVTWTIHQAKRAGLVSLMHNDAQEVVGLRARSQSGKVLPWEAYPEDMLEARATTKLGRRLFADVTMGLSYERDELEAGDYAGTVSAEQVTAAPAKPTPKAAEVLDRLKPTRRTDLADDYDPAADLALFPEGDWWTAAGAQVARRNAAQLAADRLAKWVSDNPGQDQVPLPEAPAADPAEPDDTVDAEVVCSFPGCVLPEHEEGDHQDEHGDVITPEPDDLPADPVPADDEPTVPWTDADGYTHNHPDSEDCADDCTDPEGNPVPDDEPDDAVPDDGPALDPEPEDVAADDGPVLDDAPDLAPEPATAAEVLAQIDAAAEQLGKTRAGLMVRWIATHRKNPEDATAEELSAFYDQLRPLLEAKG